MPWQGDQSNMIDRFDVRAHLDFIPDVKAPDIPPEELNQEERHCNYERYRILAQNVFLGISKYIFFEFKCTYVRKIQHKMTSWQTLCCHINYLLR